jgi:transposase, IS5 family
MHRSRGQVDLGQAWISPKLGRNPRLERIARAFDWEPVEALVIGVHSAKIGRPSWPPLLMVKALLLQRWHGLSDPALEDALGDRLSFRRFVGLKLDEGAPAYSVISRFRKTLREMDLETPLFEEIERQLSAQSLVVKRGTLRDATLAPAPVRRSRLAPPAAERSQPLPPP